MSEQYVLAAKLKNNSANPNNIPPGLTYLENANTPVVDASGNIVTTANITANIITASELSYTTLNPPLASGPTGLQGVTGLQGPTGVQGITGPRGYRGEAFQVDEFNVILTDSKVSDIESNSGASNIDFFVFVVATDTRTQGLSGIDTTGNLSNLSRHVVAYNGSTYTDYGPFTGMKGDIDLLV